jgi:hypothetical protein
MNGFAPAKERQKADTRQKMYHRVYRVFEAQLQLQFYLGFEVYVIASVGF